MDSQDKAGPGMDKCRPDPHKRAAPAEPGAAESVVCQRMMISLPQKSLRSGMMQRQM